MIFQFTHNLILERRKSQTRRLVKPGEELVGAFADDPEVPPRVETLKGSTKWQVGSTYAVSPGRGKKAVGRIQITGIRREDVRNISWDDAIAEGFESPLRFLDVWTRMHDSQLAPLDWGDHVEMLPSRPAEKYQAWVLEFALVEPGM